MSDSDVNTLEFELKCALIRHSCILKANTQYANGMITIPCSYCVLCICLSVFFLKAISEIEEFMQISISLPPSHSLSLSPSALTSKWCKWQTQQRQGTRGSTTERWIVWSSDWPSRAFWMPDSLALDCSGKKKGRMWSLLCKWACVRRWNKTSCTNQPSSCKTTKTVLRSGPQEAVAQTAPRAWEELKDH